MESSLVVLGKTLSAYAACGLYGTCMGYLGSFLLPPPTLVAVSALLAATHPLLAVFVALTTPVPHPPIAIFTTYLNLAVCGLPATMRFMNNYILPYGMHLRITRDGIRRLIDDGGNINMASFDLYNRWGLIHTDQPFFFVQGKDGMIGIVCLEGGTCFLQRHTH
jgi:hypothetical protein